MKPNLNKVNPNKNRNDLLIQRQTENKTGLNNSPLSIAAVICTRDRTDCLERALRSLLDQSLAADEIFVIDNAPSNDDTFQLVSREFPQIRYIKEDLPGLDFARNRALSEVNSSIIAFMDDDAVADTEWIKKFLEAFEMDQELGACTGRVEALAQETESQRLFEANGGFSRGMKPILLPDACTSRLHGFYAPMIAWAVSIGNGCSMALRCSSIKKVGEFDEALDMGPPLPGGGDLDMLWRILVSGQRVKYNPEALAWHEHRTDMKSIIKQITGHQKALIAFLVKTVTHTSGSARFPILFFLLWRLSKPGVRIAKRIFAKDPLPIPVLFSVWKNCILGLTAYIHSKERVISYKT